MYIPLPSLRRPRNPLLRALSVALGLCLFAVLTFVGLALAGVLLLGGIVWLAVRQWRPAPAMKQSPAPGASSPPSASTPQNGNVIEGEFVVIRERR